MTGYVILVHLGGKQLEYVLGCGGSPCCKAKRCKARIGSGLCSLLLDNASSALN